MKKWLIVVSTLLVTSSCPAANHVVLAGGTGTRSGADWSNACSDLHVDGCSPLVRGDTYYIGAGTYGNETFSLADSGTTLVTILGATVANHGTVTGWSNNLSVCTSDGGTQAQFPNGWTVSTDYWTVDGTCGGGSANNGTTIGYGFRTRSDRAGSGGVGFQFQNNVSGITVSHYEIDEVSCCDILTDSPGTDGILCFGACNVNGTFDHLYIHDVKQTCFLMAGNITVQNSPAGGGSKHLHMQQSEALAKPVLRRGRAAG